LFGVASVKVRVTSKSDIRTWNKSSGSGKLFSMDLMDESGEIRATAFKDQCDQYYDYIQVRRKSQEESVFRA
jgi:replication factor A1